MRKKILYISLILCLTGMTANASMLDYITPADPTNIKDSGENIFHASTQKTHLSQNDVRNHYQIAKQRFMQSNVKSAYADFKTLINSIVPNDYAYIRLADNMATLGLFNLCDEAVKKISDSEIAYIQAEDIKHFYYPTIKMSTKDEIFLAESFSNIMYNAQSKEATSELLKHSDLLSTYDYANYIAALGLLKTGDLVTANSYIDAALKINPNNLNYNKLKIEIVLQGKNPQTALKLFTNLKNNKLYTTTYQNQFNALEHYTLYKTEKNDSLKKYHLGYYYFYNEEYPKAIRTLQGAISSKKNINNLVYSLMSEIYFNQKELEKAENFAQKALKIDSKNSDALFVLGKLAYKNKNYDEALKYFAKSENKYSTDPSAWLAMTYEQLGKINKAKEIYAKILKTNSDSYLTYYNMGLLDKTREFEYLKKATAININFTDSWLELARYEIEKNNLQNAIKYLGIVKYIDENDFRYYYYQGLVHKLKGQPQDAKYYFKKSLALNPDYELAKKELGI